VVKNERVCFWSVFDVVNYVVFKVINIKFPPPPPAFARDFLFSDKNDKKNKNEKMSEPAVSGRG
jgi:hypothetical protein